MNSLKKIVLVGGTGMLGKALSERFLRGEYEVTISTRKVPPEDMTHKPQVHYIYGDLTDSRSLADVCKGQDIVVATAHSVLGRGKNSSYQVDEVGHKRLIDAAAKAGIKHFIYISGLGARPDHPVDFSRTKWRVEQYLKQSGQKYTIIRPSNFMELYAYELIGKGILKNGKVNLIGKGETPQNMVSLRDVAELVVFVAGQEAYYGQVLEIAGLDHVSRTEIAQKYASFHQKSLRISRLPIPVAKAIGGIVGMFHPGIKRVISMTIESEITYQPFDVRPLLNKIPIQITRIDDFIRDG